MIDEKNNCSEILLRSSVQNKYVYKVDKYFLMIDNFLVKYYFCNPLTNWLKNFIMM